MSHHDAPYGDGRAFVQALTKAAKEKATTTGKPVDRLLREAYFDRFLVRVFTDTDNRWFVKGGMAMLAREPLGRQTKDIDLATSGVDIDSALEELRSAANIDAGDHLEFELERTGPLSLPTAPESTQGARIRVTVSADAKVRARFNLDMVVSDPPLGTVQTIQPRTRLPLPRPVLTSDYRLYPLADQIADKIYATVAPREHSHVRQSTRVKDLVDLAIYARTQTVQMRPLRAALTHRFSTLTTRPTRFTIPKDWQTRFAHHQLHTPLVDASDYAGAVRDASALADAVFDRSVPDDAIWTPDRQWSLPSRPYETPDHLESPVVEPPTSEGPELG